MFDHDRFEREMAAAKRSNLRFAWLMLAIWIVVLALIIWGSIEVISAGPEGIGREIGHFIKAIREGAGD